MAFPQEIAGILRGSPSSFGSLALYRGTLQRGRNSAVGNKIRVVEARLI
jgi:hypothetical protein